MTRGRKERTRGRKERTRGKEDARRKQREREKKRGYHECFALKSREKMHSGCSDEKRGKERGLENKNNPSACKASDKTQLAGMMCSPVQVRITLYLKKELILARKNQGRLPRPPFCLWWLYPAETAPNLYTTTLHESHIRLQRSLPR